MKKTNVFTTIGARNYALEDREENDFYATEPKAVELLLEIEKFNQNIWECACGMGHMSEILKKNGYNVYNTDLFDRGYEDFDEVIDFLTTNKKFNGDIITNPPYKYAQEFVEKALEVIPEGNKVAMFLKLTFLEGQKRKHLFLMNPPKTVYVSSSRLNCAKNGDFVKYTSSAVAFAWFVWEKGYKGDTIIKWIN